MTVEYFHNRELECFSSSLANLLVEKGDEDLARAVFKSYRNHPLVGETGVMHLGLSTRLVNDLTKGKYVATLYCRDFMTRLRELTEDAFSENSDEIVNVIQTEFDAGRIKINPGTVKYEHPAMLFFKGNARSHWVVHTGYARIIDNGQKRYRPYDNKGATDVLVDERK